MIIGLYLILTAWLVPGLPLWFSILNTVLGGTVATYMITEFFSINKK